LLLLPAAPGKEEEEERKREDGDEEEEDEEAAKRMSGARRRRRRHEVEAGGGAGGAVIAAIGEREKSRRGRRRLPVPAGASAAVRAVCVGVERELCVVVPLATIGVTPPVTSSLLVEVWLVSVSAAFTFLFPVFFFLTQSFINHQLQANRVRPNQLQNLVPGIIRTHSLHQEGLLHHDWPNNQPPYYRF
jgi:hypothetical protein